MAQKNLQRIYGLFKTRLSRNILFWLVILLLNITNVEDHRKYNFEWYLLIIVITTFLLFAVTYINNWVMVPRFLARQEYIVYIPVMIFIVFLYPIVYDLVIKLMLIHFPLIKAEEINLFPIVISPHWPASQIPFERFMEISLESNKISPWLAGWLAGNTMLWYLNDHSKKEKQIQEARRRQTETELSFLKNQLNPHFLFNTMNNLYSLALKKSEQAPDAILKLSSILRYLLYESNTPLVNFEKEKEIMQAYIDLELLRLANTEGLSFSINADDNYSLPPLLWLPVLENVFKHGTRMINDAPEVDYQFRIKNGCLNIYSRNKSKKINMGTIETASGIGWVNLRKRLVLLFPGKYNMRVSQENNYYIAEVEIQLL